ncbi:MAG: Rieske 2Fe-2S domain-containing protein, partial [Actinomycetota bacterium]|nr:Rieske 2Fe-2S domain-containing protein [Actinomycetota bacterium]
MTAASDKSTTVADDPAGEVGAPDDSAPLATGVAWVADHPYHERVSVGRYLDQDVLDRELALVWAHIWQVACSVDHVRDPGDYFEYRCGPYSVLVVRGDDGELRAFQNVCRHRGNLLCQGAGSGLTELRCGFHSWSWSLKGELREVPSRRGFGALRNDDLPLLPARVDTWGPLVFVNLDLAADSLSEWLEGVPGDVEWVDIDDFHCGVTTTPVSCNWKVVSEGFSESYHVQGLHPEMARSFDDVNAPQHFWNRHAVSYQTYGVPSPRRADLTDADVWESFCATQGGRLGLPVDQTASMPELASDETAFEALAAAIRRDAAGRDVDLDRFTDQQIMGLRQYNLFPNATVLISADSLNVLVSR